MTWSKTRIDQLGIRLRASSVTPEDLELLDEYRLEFSNACIQVTNVLEQHFVRVTARSAKSTRSIAEKLQRESIRFSQMQDVAGCRVIVDGAGSQDDAVQLIPKLLEVRSVVDRRMDPSAGYRAVHLVVVKESRLVEVQIRTLLQDRWAGISETLAYMLDPKIKYGGGSTLITAMLGRYSRLVAKVEELDQPLERRSAKQGVDTEAAGLRSALLAQIETLEKALLNQRGKSEDERQP